jgi:hypothetical protein
MQGSRGLEPLGDSRRLISFANQQKQHTITTVQQQQLDGLVQQEM